MQAGGAPELPTATGRSFWRGLAEDDRNAWPAAVFCEMGRPDPARMVRRGNWKYIHYQNDEDEMYDLGEDPDEMRNLAASASHADTCRELRRALGADGWDSGRVRAALEERQPQRDYLARYARAVEPVDPWQWGLPAQL